MDAVLLITALLLGFGAYLTGLPPLAGYLVAGFVLNAFGHEANSTIEAISDVGILLLLFGIGLKLRPRTLVRKEVWGTAASLAAVGTIVPAALLMALSASALPMIGGLDLRTALIAGLALSFSSTVFAVQALERTSESTSLQGRISLGVLIFQDIVAVGFLVVFTGDTPSWWAIALIPLFLVLRPVLWWMLSRIGHGELLVLLGITAALAIGADAFDLVGVKPDLGALVAGLILSGHPRAAELADRLLAFKDLFLVGFFLSIGLGGAPPIAGWVIAAVFLIFLPTRSVWLMWVLTRFRLRARTAFQASLTLSSYSEFGLIVASAAVAEGLMDSTWIATIAVAVAGGFIGASAANKYRYRLYDRWHGPLARLERDDIVSDDAVIDVGRARVLIFGMGRVGTAVYDEIVAKGIQPVAGIDRQSEVVTTHREEGRRVVRGDALDRDFWERLRFEPGVDLVVASTSSHTANVECVRRIREFLPSARIAAVATFPDQVEELGRAGVDVARNLYQEAGQALADEAIQYIDDGRAT